MCGAEVTTNGESSTCSPRLSISRSSSSDVEEADQRYRLLEPIREYGWDELSKPANSSRRGAAMPPLSRCLRPRRMRSGRRARPTTGSRASSESSQTCARACAGVSRRRTIAALGAQIAAAATIVFLRLGFLSEGIEWSNRALQNESPLPSSVEARMRYGLSMLYSNAGSERKCLDEALQSASLYRGTRGSARIGTCAFASRLALCAAIALWRGKARGRRSLAACAQQR